MSKYNKVTTLTYIITSAMAGGFGAEAILSGLDKSYMLAASQATVSAASLWEVYGIIKDGIPDCKGFLAADLGAVAVTLNAGDWVHVVMGVGGIGASAFMGIFSSAMEGYKRK